MRHVILSLLLCILSFAVLAQDKQKLTHKPHTLEEAVRRLEEIHADTTKEKIRAMTEREFRANAHFGMGMWIRNNWGLWRGGALSDYFDSIGIADAEDMSGIILTCYYRQLKGIEWRLGEQIKEYQDYWKAAKEHQERLESDAGYREMVLRRNDSINLAVLNEKKLKWAPGKKVSGGIDRRPGFFAWYGESVKIEGDVIEWVNDKLALKVTKYPTLRMKKRLIRRYKIKDDVLIVPRHEWFHLVEE